MDGAGELSEITGIGRARARWLEATFGIRSVSDLAAVSPEEVERKLKAEGKGSVSLRTIQGWVEQAEALVGKQQGELGDPAPRARSRAVRTRQESPKWTPVGSFVVEFQSRADDRVGKEWRTVAHYLEKDRNHAWTGLERDQLCSWMIQQLELGVPIRTAPGARQPLERPGMAIDLRAYLVDGDGVEFAKLVRIDKPWAVDFSWSTDDPDTTDAGEWQLDVLLKRIGPGEPRRIQGGPIRFPGAVARTGDEHHYRFDLGTGVVTHADVDAVYRASVTIAYLLRDVVVCSAYEDLGLVCFYDPALRSSERASASVIAAA
jgi:hypothetical protein